MRKFLLAPHNDDESLFAAYTLIREKPMVIVCTDSYRQDWTDRKVRIIESIEATKILGCGIVGLGIPDTKLTANLLKDKLRGLFARQGWFDVGTIYAPAKQGGHEHHDIVADVADELWPGKVVHYMTYTKGELYTKGVHEVVPNQTEIDLKNRALDCYKSQLQKNRPHFDAVRGKSEWYEAHP